MIDAYAIGLTMNLTSNVDAAMARIAAQFKALDEVVDKTRQNVRDLVGDIGGVGRRLEGAVAQARALRDAMREAADAARRMSQVGNMVPGAMPGAGNGNAFVPPANSNIMSVLPPALMFAGGGGGVGFFGGGGGGGGGSGGMVPRPGIPLNYVPGGPPVPPGGGGPPAPSGPGGMGLLAMVSPYARAYYAAHFVHQAFTADMREEALEAGLTNQGFTREQADEAFKQAVATQQGVTGSSVIGNMNLISKLMAVVQDPKAALAMLPAFAKLGVVLDSTGKAGEGDALMAAIRAGEFRGVLSEHDAKTGEERVNPQRLQKFIEMMQATSIATKGAVGPQQMYQFMRSAGVSGATIDDKALFADSIALQMAMGSAQAGTALQGMSMQFSAGKMSQAAANLLTSMGLISNPNAVVQLGMGNMMLLPGSMDPGTMNQLRDNPTDFIMKTLLPRMQAFLAGKSGANIDNVPLFGPERMQAEFRAAVKSMQGDEYRNASPERKQQMELAFGQTLASRIPGGKDIAETIRNILLIGRDRDAVEKAMGRDAYRTTVDQNPAVRAKALGAAAESLEIAFMRLASPTIISAMTTLANGMNGIADGLNRFNRIDTSLRTWGGILPDPNHLSPEQEAAKSRMEEARKHAWPWQREYWLDSGPAAAGGGGAMPPVTMTGKIMLDNRAIGSFVAEQANRIGQTPASPDPRASPFGLGSGAAH